MLSSESERTFSTVFEVQGSSAKEFSSASPFMDWGYREIANLRATRSVAIQVADRATDAVRCDSEWDIAAEAA
jgi:hypothetical protein